MPSYVISTVTRASLRIARTSLMFNTRYAYRRVSTLPCFTLEGKVCIVTGASQGLGKEILTAFSLSGAHGAVVDLSLDSATKAVKEMQQEVQNAGLPTPNLRAYECNTSDEEAVKTTFSKIVHDFGKVDVLCTNAGITGGAPAEDQPFDQWKQMLDVNVNGTFLFARSVGRHMIDNSVKGAIIMVTSMSGLVVNRPQKQSAYNTSKAAASMLMKSLAAEWAPHGIRVNAMAPGYIATAANESDEMKELSKQWVDMIPMGRVAQPEEFRGTAVYMASEAGSYLTGHEVVVDGGYTVW